MEHQKSVKNTVFTAIMLVICLGVFFLAACLGLLKLRSCFISEDQRMHRWVLPYDKITSIQWVRFADKDGSVSICAPEAADDSTLYELVSDVNGRECEDVSLEKPWKFEFMTEEGTFTVETDGSRYILIDGVGYKLSAPFGEELADYCAAEGFSEAPVLKIGEYASGDLEPVILASSWSLESSPGASLDTPVEIAHPESIPFAEDYCYVCLDFALNPDRYFIYLQPIDEAGIPTGQAEAYADLTEERSFPLPEGAYLVEICATWELPGDTGGEVCYAFAYSFQDQGLIE